MNVFDVIVLSLVEGITEYLPISSTGHLILISYFLQIPQTDFVKSFEIYIQLGAICAVVFLYWKTFLQSKDVWKKVFVAFIPTALVGFSFYGIIKQYLFGNPHLVIEALFIGGIALIILELLHKDKNHNIESVQQIPLKTAFLIGVFQSISIIPGVSRAAATIMGGMFLGTKRKTAVEFSFLLAVPTMLAASGLDLAKSDFSFTKSEWMLIALGFFGSFITALGAIKFLLRFIQSHTFIPFGIYRIVLAVFYFLLMVKL